MAFAKVAALGELVAGKGKQVTVNGLKIALFLTDGVVRAIDDTCPHRGASLSEGQCHMGQVMCPWHSARFDLATGQHLCPPATTGVKSFPVQVVGEDVQIDV
jgi:3-phenylpropionate/trans-cinnamate dioxygenase ferredoxin component